MGAGGFSLTQFIDHKIQQLPACGQIRAGQAEDVVPCPIGQDSRVLSQIDRLRLGLTGQRQVL